MLVDSHCHLNFSDYNHDLPEVFERAKAAGVSSFLCISTKVEEIEDLQRISTYYPNVYCSVGVHPHEVSNALKANPDLKALLASKLSHPKVVGIGETGLDFYYEHSRAEEQKQAFELHCELSCDYNLPIIIHTREADNQTLEIIQKYPSMRGVFHCFSGAEALAEAALSLGFYLSASGILTFKSAASLREVFKKVPLERLLVETDSPYLAPIPYRGKRNEPAYMVETVKVLADIKEIEVERIIEQTTSNFYTLFQKAQKE